MYPCCGLIIVCSRKPVPLKGISVDVQVKGFVADVSATLKYKNVEENAVEAVFVFPMDDDSAVYSFEAIVEGKKIVADIQEKEQAHKTYDKAISQGQQAFLLEEDKSSGDIFSCSVGNLLPGQEAEVTLCFVRELPVEADSAVRFVLPAVLNPRYTPEDQELSVTAKRPQVPIGQIPYTLSLDAHFQSAYGVTKIVSNCEITPIQYTDSDKTAAKVSLAAGHKFERDVELLVYYNEVNKPSTTLEAGVSDAKAGSVMADPVVMLNFYPSFPDLQEMSSCGEFIFLMDRSGSMECNMNSKPDAPQRIQSAKETLIVLLKSLPLGCYFNIFGFGSHFASFFPESIEYTQKSMEEALEKVKKMEADFGGTEILQPLKKIYKTGCRPDHPRQLFIFTDGEVGNTRQVIKEVQQNASNHRCFTFGIGEGASTALIKGMARAGNGTFEFITGEDRMQPKALKALKHALQPSVKEVALKWNLHPGLEAVPLSRIPSAIFQRAIIYAQLKGKVDEGTKGEVSLEYKFKEEVFKNVLEISFSVGNAERPTIHRLAAKALISELENGTDSNSEEVKKKILETSIQSGVISSLTAYVAINKETKKPVEAPPMRRDIPAPGLMFGGSGFRQAMPMRMYGRLPNIKSVKMCRSKRSAAPVKRSCRAGGASKETVVMCRSKRSAAPVKRSCRAGGASKEMAMEPNEMIVLEYDFMELLQREKTYGSLEPMDDDYGYCEEVYDAAKKAETPALLKLISLQNADGSWTLKSELAVVLGVSESAIRKNKPAQDFNDSVWATILAVTWLHASCWEQRDEWELLEGKAQSWIKSKAGPSLGSAVKAANELLQSSVDQKVFGL